MQIQGHDQSTSANSVSSILECVIQRAFAIADDLEVRKSLQDTLDRRWDRGQRSVICQVGVLHLTLAIVYDLVDEAVELSMENEGAARSRRERENHERGLIWNRTSPGWRYFRAMHVYEEHYSDQTVPEIQAMNDLHQTTKDYYLDHIEKVVHTHKLKSASTPLRQSPVAGSTSSSMRLSCLIPSPNSVDHQNEQNESDSSVSVTWNLRQRIKQDCALPTRLMNQTVFEISPDDFDLKLSPHLSSALKHSDKQQKNQEYLATIKQHAKAENEATIANYSVPSPTFLKRQKNMVSICLWLLLSIKTCLTRQQELQETHAKIAAEVKYSAARQAQRSKLAAEQLKSGRAESAMKFLEEQLKMDQTIREGKRVAETARQLMEHKREEITEERITMIRNAFASDSRAGRQVVCGFSGKMQRLPSTIDQFEAKMVMYTASPNIPVVLNSKSSPNKLLSSDGSPLSSRPSTSNSSPSFMNPKLWVSVVSACTSPENSRPSTSSTRMSPDFKTPPSLSASPIQSFSASVIKSTAKSPAFETASLLPAITASSSSLHLK